VIIVFLIGHIPLFETISQSGPPQQALVVSPNELWAETWRKEAIVVREASIRKDIASALFGMARECWQLPAGNHWDKLIKARIYLAHDGDFERPPQLEPETARSVSDDPSGRSAAEAVLRALTICTPYKRMPEEMYFLWHEVVISFDPRDWSANAND
jgi:hypothetical protein